MRIGAFGTPTAAANYRIWYPLRALRRLGHETIAPDGHGETAAEVLSSCDAVLAYRVWAPEDRDRISRLRDQGVAVVWDNDDDFANLQKVRRNKRATGRSNQQILREMLHVARIAHAVTVTTQPLADALVADGVRRVHVIENYVEDDLRPGPTQDSGVTVGWIAGAEHSTDVKTFRLNETFRRLLEVHTDLRVVTLGVPLSLPERYSYVVSVPFQQLPDAMAEFDIGLAPIADTPFNRSRSNIKVKEYAASGVPWLASPHGPYAGLGEAHGGRLVSDDGWFAALDALVRDAAARERLATAGRAWAATETTDKVAAVYERIFAEAVERASGRPAESLILSRPDTGPARRRFKMRLPGRSLSRS